MLNDLVAARAVVLLYDDPASFCWWARLDNGLELALYSEDAAKAPRFELSPGWHDGGRRLSPIEQVERILGLPGRA